MSTNWESTYVASIWWCGDEVCDCYQPQIVLHTPNLTVGRPWMRQTEIWTGTFVTDGNSGGVDLEGELQAECERRGIPVGASRATDITWDDVKRIDDEQMAQAKALTKRYA